MKTTTRVVRGMSSIIVAAVLLTLALSPAPPVHADTCTVTSNADSGTGTLRAQVADTNCSTINFDGDYTIRLSNELDLTRNVTIDGTGHSVIISGDTDGDGTGNVRVFDVWEGKTVTLQNLTIVKGRAAHGGGIHNAGALTLTNSSFSGNSADYGGAIWNQGTVVGTNCTFTGNGAYLGGAIHGINGMATFRNTLMANNGGGSCYSNGGGASSLSSDTTCGGFTYSTSTLTGALGSASGSPQSIPLLPGSAAIDAGDANYCPTADQRGVARVGTCDIGAFESQGFTVTVSGGNSQSTAVATAFANPLAVTVANAFGEPLEGGVITFTSPTLGPGTYPATFTATIDATGAASATATANYATGAYTVIASARIGTPATFDLTNTGTSYTLTASGGNNQSTPTTLPVASPLEVTLTAPSGSPVAGGLVTFAGPTAGASTNPATFTATTNASGVASATATANGLSGSYDVVASVGGVSATFQLTNSAVTLALSGGNDQSVGVTTIFANPLAVIVTGASGPVQGAVVTFAGPTSGASTSPATVTATTDASGVASAPATANGTEGVYDVIASLGEKSVTFRLTNVACPANTVTVTNGNDSGAGSLRQAIASICPGGTITFGGDTTIHLASQLTLGRNVTIDGSGHTVVISGDSDEDGDGDVRAFQVDTDATAALQDLTIEKGYADVGGAIYVAYGNGSLAATNCTFAGNTAAGYPGGGAIMSRSSGAIALTANTFSGNSASFYGGAVCFSSWNSNSATLTSNTFAENDGGAIYVDEMGYVSLTMHNNLIARHGTAWSCGFTHPGSYAVGSNNLSDDPYCFYDDLGTYVESLLLGPLGDYGGGTQTIPLLPGSPAIDAGDTANCPTYDQRGVARVGACDIGAYEIAASAWPSPPGTSKARRSPPPSRSR